MSTSKSLKDKSKLQPITDEAWLVHKGKEKTGILNKDAQNHFTYITGKDFFRFDNEEEVREHFGNDKLFETPIRTQLNSKEKFFIDGFEIKHENPIPVDSQDPRFVPGISLFTKTEKSDVLYAAGYFVIDFDKCWKYGYCPKYSTLIENGYKGPLRSLAECRAELKKLNKIKREQMK